MPGPSTLNARVRVVSHFTKTLGGTSYREWVVQRYCGGRWGNVAFTDNRERALQWAREARQRGC